MSGFEIITITLSFILGLGVAQVLSSLSQALRTRRRRPLHWLPLGYAASIFLFQIQYWFAVFDLEAAVEQWTWLIYGSLLLLGVLLFLGAGLVLPHGEVEGDDLLADFESEGRLSVLLVAGYLVGWMPLNAYLDSSWLTDGVYFNALVSTVLLVAYFPTSSRTRTAASVLFFILQAYGLAFVWSTPVVLG